MKKISNKCIIIGNLIIAVALLGSFGITYTFLFQTLHLPLQYEFLYIATFFFSFLMLMILQFRLWLLIFPTPIGKTPEKDLWHVHVYQLFYVAILTPILKSPLPIPLLRVIYLVIGAKMGDNSYTGGMMSDAHLIKIGSNSIIGDTSLLTPHQIEGQTLGYYPIVIGNNVTVGAHAVILPGVIIEDDAIVASGAVVLKGTHIQRGEVWGGVPARRLNPSNIAS